MNRFPMQAPMASRALVQKLILRFGPEEFATPFASLGDMLDLACVHMCDRATGKSLR